MRSLVQFAVRASRSARPLRAFKPTPSSSFHSSTRWLCPDSQNDDDYRGFAHTLAERVEQWSSSMEQSDPDFFPKSAKGQSPKILWIGCADSRIPESTILGLKPGEVFVHRNIANIITPTDINSLSVIEFAVAHLKVEHILVCGHTSCGGVNAALGNTRLGLLDIWLQPMRQLRMEHTEELEKFETQGDKTHRLSQYNILRSLEVLRMNPTVMDAVAERGLELHGVIYHVENGKLEVVESSEDESKLKKRLAAFTTKKSA